MAYIYTVVLWCPTKDNVSQTKKENIHGAMFALLSQFSVYEEYIFAESQRRLLKIFKTISTWRCYIFSVAQMTPKHLRIYKHTWVWDRIIILYITNSEIWTSRENIKVGATGKSRSPVWPWANYTVSRVYLHIHSIYKLER